MLAVELSNGQMVEDVRLALNGSVPVEFYGRVGGNVPSVREVKAQVFARMAWRSEAGATSIRLEGTTKMAKDSEISV